MTGHPVEASLRDGLIRKEYKIALRKVVLLVHIGELMFFPPGNTMDWQHPTLLTTHKRLQTHVIGNILIYIRLSIVSMSDRQACGRPLDLGKRV